MKAVGELNSFHNNLVHGPWGVYDMQFRFWEKTKVDGANYKLKTFRVKREEIVENIKRAREIRESLLKLTGTVVREFLQEMRHEPWPDKLRRQVRRRHRTRDRTPE
jgi:hypothetical protein